MFIYLNTIKLSLLIFIFVAFLITFPITFFEYRRYGFFNIKKACIVFSLIFYLQTVFLLTSLPLPPLLDLPRFQYNPLEHMQIIPFKFIRDLFHVLSSGPINQTVFSPTLYENLFNLIMLVPLGIYLRAFFGLSFKKVFLLSFLFSLFLELTQLTGIYFIYPIPYRLFDVDDLILNTLGALIGYGMSPLFHFISINQSKQLLKSQSLMNQPASMMPQYVSMISDYILFNLISTFIWFVFGGILYYVSTSYSISPNLIVVLQRSMTWIVFLFIFILYPITNNQTISMFLLNYRIEVNRRVYLIIRNLILYSILLSNVLWFPFGIIPLLTPFLHIYIIILILLKKPQTFLDKQFHITHLRKKKGF